MTARCAPALIAASVTTLLAGLVTSSPALADAAPPQVTFVAPPSTIENGQPIAITLSGTGMRSATDLTLFPSVATRTVQVVSDNAMVVTLPANVAPGVYTVRLTSPVGSSAPGTGQFTILPATPVQADPGATQLPVYTFGPPTSGGVVAAPAPTAAPNPRHTSVAPVLVQQVGSNRALTSPVFVLMLGIVIGGAMVVLWGHPGRIPIARRRDFLAQLVARPAQRLHLGRICMQCGKLHWVFRTRRDLWKAGHSCSATCFVAAQEEELALRSSADMAPLRLRRVGVLGDVDEQLDLVLATAPENAEAPAAT